MTDYPYEQIAAGFRAMAGSRRPTAEEIKVERVGPNGRGVKAVALPSSAPVRVHNTVKSKVLPKRIPGASWAATCPKMSDAEVALAKRGVTLYLVRAPWVEGLHFDDRV